MHTTPLPLLQELQNGDPISWERFHQLYRPLIITVGGDYNLSWEDRDELVQAVLLKFYSNSRKFVYDRSKGRFRDYFRCIIRNCAIDIIRSKNSDMPLTDEHETIDDSHDEKWEEEWRLHIFSQALAELRGQVKPETYELFELYAIQNIPPRKVAEITKTNIQHVYDVKNRLLNMLRPIITRLQETT